MEVLEGFSYHIKDEFFQLVQDPFLMSNKEDQGYRPHFVCFVDNQNHEIVWAIPQSTRVKKYKAIAKKKIAKYKRCDTILFGNFGGKENAFLLQNMFPVAKCFVDHPHTIDDIPVKVQSNFLMQLRQSAHRVLALHKKGVKVIFPDVDRIYQIMESTMVTTDIH